MKLKKLITANEIIDFNGDPETEVSSVAYDSRAVTPGSLFIAVKGHLDDGRRYVKEAVKAGAMAIMVDEPLSQDPGVPVIMVSDTRRGMALAAAEFYGHPAEKLVMIGITGTKGKTTTAFLLESILKQAGQATGLMGTIKISYAGKERPSVITTPEGVDLQKYLHEMVQHGVTHTVFEVSSHALALSRVAGCEFDVGVFTNLGRDHLDYHRDMTSYYEAKRRLFYEFLTGVHLDGGPRAVINVDDEWGRKMAAEMGPEVITFAIESEADLTAREIKNDRLALSAQLVIPAGELEVHTHLLGSFNLYNLLAASGAALALGIEMEHIAAGLESIASVPGRLERIGHNDDFLVLVDYAHTTEALIKALESARELAPGRLFTVFGCGGDRDKSKRHHMGRAAGRLSDLAVVTNDNPRTEDPAAIIKQIEPGLLGLDLHRWEPGETNSSYPPGSYAIIPDRRKALQLGVRLMRSGDILLVAGKGHESYQIMGREKIHFDDREEALMALKMEGKT
ncbi:MAG: UDP-N-acetylmuramoyl-L-alanyl-D-glutamate--2,6-diaminopimelate ligase [Deltaproteobacteria bacterium]|nr:UDP-N-acetylmuramoyl-L-alanyl-D-glutamate--2,6-diaminopimelate ligase [Deltaproteobacteria bacterium]MBW2085208.1 UDP-N-acetylmuramoyl-L-alanyl-D-glutamate--2,6-diaminopimelate ligase [Deltaproteobacteria bacterium]